MNPPHNKCCQSEFISEKECRVDRQLDSTHAGNAFLKAKTDVLP